MLGGNRPPPKIAQPEPIGVKVIARLATINELSWLQIGMQRLLASCLARVEEYDEVDLVFGIYNFGKF